MIQEEGESRPLFKESLINSATHLHASALSSRRRQILDVAPLRLRFVSSIDTAHLRKSGRLHFISASLNFKKSYIRHKCRRLCRRAMRGKWVRSPCCPAAVIGEFVSMGNDESRCFVMSLGEHPGKTETNDDPRARKPAYDKIHCLTYERWGDGCQGVFCWQNMPLVFCACRKNPHVLSWLTDMRFFMEMLDRWAFPYRDRF